MSITIFQRHPQRVAALENGDLVDVTDITLEGKRLFTQPIAVTRAAWDAVVVPSREESDDSYGQADIARARWLLQNAEHQIRKRWNEDLTRLEFSMSPNGDFSSTNATTVVIVATRDDKGDPALTIGLPEEFGSVSSSEADKNASQN